MSRILVDSSVIIESLKGNEKALELFRSIKDDELAINPIVFSEVVYIFMRYGKKDVNKGFRPIKLVHHARFNQRDRENCRELHRQI